MTERNMRHQAIKKTHAERITLSNIDYARLSTLFETADEKGWKWIDELDEKLINAEIIDPEKVPSDLVTMNSRVLCRLPDRMIEGKKPSVLTLVYPLDANIEDNKVSVLSHVGRAILGRRVGEVITWRGNDGFTRKLKIEKLDYQPEEQGDWHL